MLRHLIVAGAGGLLLAGCGSSPSPPPDSVVQPADLRFQTGLWRMRTDSKLPVVNGATISVAEGLLPADKDETFCGIPQFTDLQNVEARLRGRLDTDCEGGPPVLDGGRISGEVECAPVQKGSSRIDVRLTFGGTYAEDEVDARMRVSIRETRPTGATNLITVTGRKTAERLGDC